MLSNKDTREEILKIIQEESKLRLFLSVDIVNSTLFKREEKTKELWESVVKDFYENFHALFNDALNAKFITPAYKDIKLNKPNIWKYVGDQIIYEVNLTHKTASNCYVIAFIDSIEHFVTKYYNETYSTLDLKASAWTAGFPVNNIEVQPIHCNLGNIGEGNNNNNVYDFIGPAMDEGFRVTECAKSSKFTVSVPLAVLLLSDMESFKSKINIHEKINFKGIVKSYPLCYMDMNTRVNVNKKEKALLIKVHPDQDNLLTYLKKHIEKEFLFIPLCEDSQKFITDEYMQKFITKNTENQRIIDILDSNKNNSVKNSNFEDIANSIETSSK